MNLLEPVDEVAVLVPDDHVGAVMSDLSGRRGRVLGTEQGRRGPHAGARPRCPQVELTRYAIDLRVAIARRRHVHPHLRALRADARVGSRQGEDIRLRR